jgi:hypothetical protein
MWEFYLSYCEAGFKSRNIDLILNSHYKINNKKGLPMIKTKIMRSILLIMSVFLITSCSNKSAMKPEDFKNKEPRLIIEEYLSGNV